MTAQTQPPTPGGIERFSAWLLHFVMDIGGRIGWGGITQPACRLITRRIGESKRRILRIVASIRAGAYTLRRRASAPRGPAIRKPAPPEAIPQKFGWAADLLPKDAGPFRNSIVYLLQDPEMIRLLQTAPGPLGRPLRSLCWMFGLRPPPILAPPKRPPRPRPPKPAPAAASPEAPGPRPRLPPSVAAKWPHAAPLLRRAGFAVKLPPPRQTRRPKPA